MHDIDKLSKSKSKKNKSKKNKKNDTKENNTADDKCCGLSEDNNMNTIKVKKKKKRKRTCEEMVEISEESKSYGHKKKKRKQNEEGDVSNDDTVDSAFENSTDEHYEVTLKKKKKCTKKENFRELCEVEVPDKTTLVDNEPMKKKRKKKKSKKCEEDMDEAKNNVHIEEQAEKSKNRKKKAKKNDESFDVKEKTDALSHDVEATSTLLIGNLNVSTNEKSLHQVFAGALSVHIPQDKTGVSKGFAYVEYEAIDDAVCVMYELSDREIDGNAITIDFTQKPENSEDIDEEAYSAEDNATELTPIAQLSQNGDTSDSIGEPSTTLHVGNLSYDTTVESLQEAFETAHSARVLTDEQGKSKSFGFVEFHSIEDATVAQQMYNGQILDGRPVKITFAAERKIVKKSFGGGTQQVPTSKLLIRNLDFQTSESALHGVFHKAWFTNLALTAEGESRGFAFMQFKTVDDATESLNEMNGYELDGRALQIEYGRDESVGKETKELCVKHLSYDTTEESLKEAFTNAVSVRLKTDPTTGKSRGFAFVKFQSKKDAKKALMTYNGQILDGRQVRIEFATDYVQIPESNKSESAVKKTDDETPTAKLMLRNLSYQTNEADLKALFQNALSVHVALNKATGGPRGFGFVSFQTIDEATKSLQSFNGHNFKGRAINVTYASDTRNGAAEDLPPSPVIMIHNLPYSMDESTLKTFFTGASSIRMGFDKVTEQCKGFAFVTYNSIGEATSARDTMNGKEVNGRSIQIRYAYDGDKGTGRNQGGQRGGHRGGQRGGHRGGQRGGHRGGQRGFGSGRGRR